MMQAVTAGQVEKPLLAMPIVTDVTGIKLTSLHVDVDEWIEVLVDNKWCRDLHIRELVEYITRLWNYKGDRGAGFSLDQKWESNNRIQVFSLMYYATLSRSMACEIYVIRTGPESFRVTKVLKQSGRNDRFLDLRDERHPDFYCRAADGSLDRRYTGYGHYPSIDRSSLHKIMTGRTFRSEIEAILGQSAEANTRSNSDGSKTCRYFFGLTYVGPSMIEVTYDWFGGVVRVTQT